MSNKIFIPPSLIEIREYVKEKGYNVNPEVFFDYFTIGNWIDSKGNKVKNWKQKIITWNNSSFGNMSSKLNNNIKKTKLFPINGRNCSIKSCKMPAIYKSSGNGYDHFYCSNHMPEEVKKLYY
jgi:hypothetical protein